MLFRWCWVQGLYVYADYNYRCCPACWSVIKKQLWEYLEDRIKERPANLVWGFLVESATRSQRHESLNSCCGAAGRSGFISLCPLSHTHPDPEEILGGGSIEA